MAFPAEEETPKLKLFFQRLGDELTNKKILLAITVVILLFLIFNHPDQIILFLVAVVISIEVGLLMYKFYQTDLYKSYDINFTPQEEIIVASTVAGISGYMVGHFTHMLLEQVEHLFTQLADMVYKRDNMR